MLRFGGAQRVGGSFKAVESSAEDRRFFEEAAEFGVVDVGDGRAERGAERFRRREPGRFGERRRNEEFAQKEARSQARRDDERMETAKTDSGADGQIFFEKRRGIDDGSRLGVWKTVEKKGAKSF